MTKYKITISVRNIEKDYTSDRATLIYLTADDAMEALTMLLQSHSPEGYSNEYTIGEFRDESEEED